MELFARHTVVYPDRPDEITYVPYEYSPCGEVAQAVADFNYARGRMERGGISPELVLDLLRHAHDLESLVHDA